MTATVKGRPAFVVEHSFADAMRTANLRARFTGIRQRVRPHGHAPWRIWIVKAVDLP